MRFSESGFDLFKTQQLPSDNLGCFFCGRTSAECEGAAGWTGDKIIFTDGGCPVAVTTQKCPSHAFLLLLTSMHVYADVCGLFSLVCLSRVYVCVCPYCQPVMENVPGPLPHFVPDQI